METKRRLRSLLDWKPCHCSRKTVLQAINEIELADKPTFQGITTANLGWSSRDPSTCYNRDMLRKWLLWFGKCLLFCLLGIFIAGRLSDMLNPPIWWVLHKNGITLLDRPSFIASYYLPLIGIYGLLLGLIPIHRLQELLASSLGKFRFTSNLRPEMALSDLLLSFAC
jgi:hypothetical protein